MYVPYTCIIYRPCAFLFFFRINYFLVYSKLLIIVIYIHYENGYILSRLLWKAFLELLMQSFTMIQNELIIR